MAAAPQFVKTPRIGIGQISAANPNRDGTGTLVTILTGAATGTRVLSLEVKAIAATTAGVVRLFIHNGTTAFLWREVEVTAVTPSDTVAAFSDIIVINDDVILPDASWSIRASTEKAETFNVIILAGDY